MSGTLPILILGTILLIHLTFVNINIGLGFYSLILRCRSLSNPGIGKIARRVFKFLIASEAVSGVYGTMITVVLGGLWPTLFNVATSILFIPLMISILGIIMRLTSITAYWYTWDRVSSRIHLSIGFLMAFSGLMIPAGFRYIFAFIDVPTGLTNLNPIRGSFLEALMNPVYPPLILHTWFGALSTGFLAASAGLAWSSKKDIAIYRWSGYASLLGGLMIIPQGLTGFWFWSTLSFHSPYLFYSMSKSFLPFGRSLTDVSFTFLGMVALAVTILILGIVHHYQQSKRWIAYSLAVLAVVTLILGEITHDMGRLPYMLIIGGEGISAEAFINRLIIIEPAITISGISAIIFFTSVFITLLYLYLVKGILQE